MQLGGGLPRVPRQPRAEGPRHNAPGLQRAVPRKQTNNLTQTNKTNNLLDNRVTIV